MKKFFTFIAIACLSVINAVAAITYETDVEYKSLAELDGKTFAIVNKAEGKALYGSNAQNLGYGAYADAFKSTNSGYMWKAVKDDEVDAYYLQLVTPTGDDYNCWNMGGVLNSQGEPQGWACSFILGKSDKKGQDIPNGALYELVYTENGWTMKNVGTGMYTQYSNGPANSTEPTYWTFCTIKEVGEEDPRPTITVLESLKPFIENKTIFTLKNGDSYMYGPDNQNIAMGTWEQASSCEHIAGYILENTEYEYRLRAVKADGSDVTVYGKNPCYLNTQPNQGGAIFNLGIDQDCALGSSWILEEAADGKYTIKSLATNGYLQTNTTNETVTEWELYVPQAAKVTIDNVSLTVANESMLDEEGDLKLVLNYEINVNDPELKESTMLSAVASYVALDAEGNVVDSGKRTPKISAKEENVYVSNLEGGKEYTVKIDKFFVIDRTNADYETNWGDTVAIVENAAEVKVTPVAPAPAPVEIKNMSITNDPKSLIDEEGDYTVTFNYTATINDETIKPEDLFSIIKYEVYDAETYALVSTGSRDFDLTEGTRNVYVSGLTAGKSYIFFVTSLVVMNDETDFLNLTSGLPKLTFKVKDPNAPQAISMSDMSLVVAEGEKIDEEGDFKVTFNYTATINDASAIQMPYAMAEYEVTDAEGKSVKSSVANFSIDADTKNIYLSGLEEGKTYTMTITKISIEDIMTDEVLCETTKDLPSVTFTAGEAPAPASVQLTKDMFKTWDGFDASATVVGEHPYFDAADYGTELNAGGVVYGSGNVTNTDYADLSSYDKMVITGKPGLQLRIMINRQADNTLVEINKTIGEDGTVEVDLSSYEYVHLNAIKLGWGSPAGAVDNIMLYGGGTTSINNATISTVKTVGKFVENGKVVIVKNGKKYTMNGVLIK